MNRIKPSHLFWLALLTGLIVRLIIIFQPEANLLTRWGSDDLYYYSQIAGHIASGDGFTFDGIHSTNGFQPLFLFVLIPFGKLMLNDWYSSWIVVSLVVTLLSVLACFQLRKWAREMEWSEWLAVLLPGFFILHPKILSVTFNGTEGALSFLMLVLTLRAFLWMKEKRNFLPSIAVFSLFVITRMEFSLILFFLAAFALIQGQSLKHWFLVAIGPIITFGAWMTINFVSLGNIVTSSGQAKATHATWYEFPFFEGIKGAIGTVFYAESAFSWVIIGLTLIGLYALFLKKDRNLWGLLLCLGLVSIVLMIVTIKTLHGFRDWYFVPQYLILLILVAHGIEWFVSGKKLYLVMFPVVIGMLWGEATWKPRTFDGQFVIHSCKDLEKILAPGTLIGVYNAGLPSACLGEKYTVVNLDGVVNNSVLKYLEKRELGSYVGLEKIEFIFDTSLSLLFFRNKAGIPSHRMHVFYDKNNVWHLERVMLPEFVHPSIREAFEQN